MCVRYARRGAIRAITVERLGDGEVRGVRPVAQRVDDQRVDAVEQRPRRVVEAVAVGQVGEAAEAEAEDRHLAVPQRHRHDAHAAERERPVDLVRDRARGMPPPSRGTPSKT